MSCKDGDSHKLANLFEPAHKWSTPTVYAGRQWTQSDQAPPNSAGFVTDTDCSNGWDRLDRDTAVVGMVARHHATGGAAVSDWQTKSSPVIGFGRSGAGFFAVNNGSGAVACTFATGMADGTYSDVVDGGATCVAGSIDAPGGRDAPKAVRLSSCGYPVRSGAANVPLNTSFT
ncbi:alpha amylase C-terminal domain-containing protein [Streptomyces sp. NPDC059224]|uniref:alpha amylase C-terminal domain-containing protein n=1 Tax=Streptomyces sp. NPDC059224 TaxID=3346775 RepID=UPI00368AFD54